MKKISDEIKEVVVSMFLQSYKPQFIAETVKVSKCSVFTILIDKGLHSKKEFKSKPTQKSKWLLANKDYIIESYLKGVDQAKLAKEFNINFATVTKLLRDNGVHTRNRREAKLLKNKINHDFFSDIFNKPEAQYFAGLLATDGSIEYASTKKYRIRLGLHYRDSDILHYFAEKLNTKVSYDKRKSYDKFSYYCSICVYSEQMFNDLVSLGIGCNKSYDLKVNENLVNCNSFVRGVADGDGWICLNRNSQYNLLYPQFGICSASKDFIDQIYEKLKKLAPDSKATIGVKLPKHRENTNIQSKATMYDVRICGWKNTTSLLTQTHGDPENNISMNRKQKTASDIILLGNMTTEERADYLTHNSCYI